MQIPRSCDPHPSDHTALWAKETSIKKAHQLLPSHCCDKSYRGEAQVCVCEGGGRGRRRGVKGSLETGDRRV